eukprot:534425-Rhodomonas_salina.2
MSYSTTSRGFEPPRGDPSRFRVCRLNRSATMSHAIGEIDKVYILMTSCAASKRQLYWQPQLSPLLLRLGIPTTTSQ